MQKYNKETDEWIATETCPKSQINRIDQLTAITYNVLYDTWDGKTQYFRHIFQPEIRYRHVLLELECKNPTFISLNEVSNTMLDLIKESEWVKENYYLTVDDNPQWYSKPVYHFNVILSKIPAYETHMFILPGLPKKVLTNMYQVDFCGRFFDMSFSSIHLTSIDRNYDKRIAQFNVLHDWLQRLPNCPVHILAGDMNFHDESENTIYLSKGYQDCWLKTNPDDPGITFDSINNKLIHVMFGGMEKRQMRLDRMLLYDNNNMLKPDKMEIIGNKPVFPDRVHNYTSKWYAIKLWLRGIWSSNENVYSKYLYPSDHFGGYVEFGLPWIDPID